MRLLFITYGFPWPTNSGARLRDAALIEAARRHYDVTVLSLFESVEEQALVAQFLPQGVSADGVVLSHWSPRIIANALLGVVRGRPLASAVYYRKAFEVLIRTTLAREEFDIVQIEHSLLAPYISALPASYSGRTILDLHNLGASQYRSMLALQSGWQRV